MSALSNFAFGGAIVIAVVLVPIFLLTVAIFIVGVSNRSDADPRGARPIAAYSFSAAFLFLWITVFAVVAALDSLINMIGNNTPSFGSIGSIGSSAFPLTTFGISPGRLAARTCVLAAIVLVFAGGAYLLHLRRGNALADTEDDPTGPTKRVMRSFVAFVCFVAIVLFVFAFIRGIYDVFELISPSVFGGSGSRTADWRRLLDALVLVVASGLVFSYHQRFAPSSLRLLGAVKTHRTSVGAPPEPPAVP